MRRDSMAQPTFRVACARETSRTIENSQLQLRLQTCKAFGARLSVASVTSCQFKFASSHVVWSSCKCCIGPEREPKIANSHGAWSSCRCCIGPERVPKVASSHVAWSSCRCCIGPEGVPKITNSHGAWSSCRCCIGPARQTYTKLTPNLQP